MCGEGAKATDFVYSFLYLSTYGVLKLTCIPQNCLFVISERQHQVSGSETMSFLKCELPDQHSCSFSSDCCVAFCSAVLLLVQEGKTKIGESEVS